MCEHGTDTILRVPILKHTGEVEWAERGVDACIAPIVSALNAAGILTAGSCCGHGKSLGDIPLHDGRWLTISRQSLSHENFLLREQVNGLSRLLAERRRPA